MSSTSVFASEQTLAARPGQQQPKAVRWALADPGRLLVYVLLTLAGVLSLFPLYWLFVTSLSPQQFIVKVPPELIPRDLTLQNYQRLFGTTPVVRWLGNTALIAGAVTLFHLLSLSILLYAVVMLATAPKARPMHERAVA